MSRTLVNFLADESLVRSFTTITRSLGYTRTSLLVGFMQDFCVENMSVLEKQNRKIEQLNQALMQQHVRDSNASQQRYLATPQDHDDEGPLSIFYNDGGDFHDNNF